MIQSNLLKNQSYENEQNDEEQKLYGTIYKSKLKIQTQKDKSNEEKINELDSQIIQVDSNIKLSDRFKSHIIVGYEQQKLTLLLESNQARMVTSIPHINQKIDSNNLELLFYVLSENLRKDQNRTLLITPKSSKIGLASVLYPEASDHYCWKINIKNRNYDEIMNDDQKQAEFRDTFLSNVSKSLSVPISDIRILDIVQGSVQVIFTVISKERMSQAELQALEEICGGSVEIFNYFACGEQNTQVGLSSEDFSPQYNMSWGPQFIEKDIRGPKNHRYEYFFPRGYTGYALNVLNKYGNDNKWLLMDGNDDEWRILYHGTKQQWLSKIVSQGLKPGDQQAYQGDLCAITNQKVGRGVYFSDKISVCEQYADQTKVGNKKFVLLFQTRVNPKALKQSQSMKRMNYYVVNNTQDIRPYRILLKEM